MRNRQVFFPIPFSEYSPAFIYPSDQPPPNSIVVNKNVGHFDTYSFQFVAFYNIDLKKVISKIKINQLEKNIGLYELFNRHKEFHILRATDQAFRSSWKVTEHCDVHTPEQECNAQKQLGLGTKAQLASFLIQNYQKLFKSWILST